jgi:hypothetical protein
MVSMSRNRLLSVMRCATISALSFPIRNGVACSNHAWPTEADGAPGSNGAERGRSVPKAAMGGPIADLGGSRLSA